MHYIYGNTNQTLALMAWTLIFKIYSHIKVTQVNQAITVNNKKNTELTDHSCSMKKLTFGLCCST